MYEQERYFIPVKDLIPTEVKDVLAERFWAHETHHADHNIVLSLREMKRYWNNSENVRDLYNRKNYRAMNANYDLIKQNIWFALHTAKTWERKNSDSFRSDIVGLFIETTNLNIDKNEMTVKLKEFEENYVTSEEGYTVNQFEGIGNSVWGRFHTSQTNKPLHEETVFIQEFIEENYGSDDFCFLHTGGPRETIAKHVDPQRQATITFPLEPDLDSYRNLNYYKLFTDEEPVHIVDYKKINTCVLLNNQEIHSIEDNDPSQLGKESLCFQISYFTKTYGEVKEMLSDKGLLDV